MTSAQVYVVSGVIYRSIPDIRIFPDFPLFGSQLFGKALWLITLVQSSAEHCRVSEAARFLDENDYAVNAVRAWVLAMIPNAWHWIIPTPPDRRRYT